MKFGQFINCNMRNIFLEKSYTRCGGETSPRPFPEKKIEHISRSIVSNFIQFVFIAWQVEGYRNILKLSCRPLAFTLFEAFLKYKKRSGTSHSARIIFEEKYFWCYVISIDQISSSGLPLLCEILGKMCVRIVCKPDCDVMNFEVNLVFLIKLFLLHDQNVVTKT